MSLLPRLCLILALAGVLSGCQTNPAAQGAGASGGDVTPNAVAGGVIEVTALDAPATAAPVPSAAVAAAAEPATAAPASPAGPETGTPLAAPDPLTVDAAAPTTGAAGAATEITAPDAAEPEVEAAPPPPPKSELQIACERKRGTWAATEGGLRICIRPTKDGGKRCTRESQCEGVCLARSQTCAPAKPLLGCNEVLQDNGMRATECIE
jgi:hypothetical protein